MTTTDLDRIETRIQAGTASRAELLELAEAHRDLRRTIRRYEDREGRARAILDQRAAARAGRCVDCGSHLHDAHIAGPEDDTEAAEPGDVRAREGRAVTRRLTVGQRRPRSLSCPQQPS
jgi:hypothetical protein